MRKRDRNHFHLFADSETATAVGSRRGKPIVLTIESGRMAQDGHQFLIAANNVWLTDRVPASYLDE